MISGSLYGRFLGILSKKYISIEYSFWGQKIVSLNQEPLLFMFLTSIEKHSTFSAASVMPLMLDASAGSTALPHTLHLPLLLLRIDRHKGISPFPKAFVYLHMESDVPFYTGHYYYSLVYIQDEDVAKNCRKMTMPKVMLWSSFST